jgi:ATP-binding cassette subfamily B protein/subfamily B ATP-binding cassette protein MsbA
MKSVLRALRFFRPDAAPIVFALGLLLVSTGASLLKPWPLALIVDCVLSGKPLPAWMSWAQGWTRNALLLFLGVSIVVLYAGQGMLSAWQNYASIRIGLRGLVRVRNEVFRWLEHLSLRFHQGQSQGDLIYRLSWDTYAFQTLFQQGIFTFLGAFLSLALMLVVMWRLNQQLAAVALLMIPLLLLSMKFLGRGMSRRSLAAHQADSRVTSSIQQTMTALTLIQSYTQEDREYERFTERVHESYLQRLCQHAWEVLYWLAIAIGFGITAAGLTWLGAREVLAGRLTVGQLLVFLGYLTQLYDPLNQLSHVGATVSDASAGTQRVLELLDASHELADAPDARPVRSGLRDTPEVMSHDRPDRESVQIIGDRAFATAAAPDKPVTAFGNLSFHRASFGYDPSRLVLHEVSFTAAAGESIAIIGPSGAGKTTLLQLLPRFYDPTSGSVQLEQVDLRSLRLRDLRTQMALVLQEPILLLGSVGENIAYGRPGASMAKIQSAAQAANAEEFILKLPRQYETLVGEGAAHLSTGEKQRLNLARAFLKDAPILVLDEPTSALDPESEQLVVSSLAHLMRNRTAILVAHRLSTIRAVDRVLVLEGGRLVESGRPDELLGQEGYYARVSRGV